jgi:hypothetical protein
MREIQKECPLDDGTNLVISFTRDLFSQEVVIYEIKHYGRNNEMLNEWNFRAMPRSIQVAIRDIGLSFKI